MFRKQVMRYITISLCAVVTLNFVTPAVASAGWSGWEKIGKAVGYKQPKKEKEEKPAHNELGKAQILGNRKMYQIISLGGGYKKAAMHANRVGAHLAVIDSAEKNEMLKNFMISQKVKNAYFGLIDKDFTDNWRLPDGSEPVYTNWQEGEPNRKDLTYKYAMLMKNGSWKAGPFSDVGEAKGGTYFILEWDKVFTKEYDPNAGKEPERRPSSSGGAVYYPSEPSEDVISSDDDEVISG